MDVTYVVDQHVRGVCGVVAAEAEGLAKVAEMWTGRGEATTRSRPRKLRV